MYHYQLEKKKLIDKLLNILEIFHVIEIESHTNEINIHPDVASKVADKLVHLVNIPRMKKLMTDIFVRMLYDDGFNRNTYGLTVNLIKDYLDTDHCLRMSTKLVTDEVMQNSEIRKNMFQLLEEFLLEMDKGPG